MNELAIIAALKATREKKLKDIDESEKRLIEAVKRSHDLMRDGVNSHTAPSPDPTAPLDEKVDAAEVPFPPVRADAGTGAEVIASAE